MAPRPTLFVSGVGSHQYQPLGKPYADSLTDTENSITKDEDYESSTSRFPATASRGSSTIVIAVIAAFILGAIVGVLPTYFLLHNQQVSECSTVPDTQPRIPLNNVARKFNYTTPFTDRPPSGPESGNISEPVWDSLVPTGLGYFKDPEYLNKTSIPTVFHQLHCLYTLRRIFYATLDGQENGGMTHLSHFDHGKNRTDHVAHCFDYLQQGLTCNADTTVEPGSAGGHFLGEGLQRQCRDYEGLKAWVQQRRVFDAEGFFARGYENPHGHDHGH